MTKAQKWHNGPDAKVMPALAAAMVNNSELRRQIALQRRYAGMTLPNPFAFSTKTGDPVFAAINGRFYRLEGEVVSRRVKIEEIDEPAQDIFVDIRIAQLAGASNPCEDAITEKWIAELGVNASKFGDRIFAVTEDARIEEVLFEFAEVNHDLPLR